MAKTTTLTTTRLVVEGALMIALATALSYLKIFELPQGGSITIEMLPLIIMGLRNGVKWGALTGFVHGVIQMILGFKNVMYCTTILSQFGCIMLDYVLAFTVLGLPLILKFFFGKKHDFAGVIAGTIFVCVLRFICSFLSGLLIWGSYAPEGQSAAVYSFLYNGSYMLPNTIICVIVVVLMYKIAPKIFAKQKQNFVKE